MTVRHAERSYRIGEVAERAGVTTRTIRYYEQLGLLGAEPERRREPIACTERPTSSGSWSSSGFATCSACHSRS